MLERLCERLGQEWEVEGGFVSTIPGLWIIPLDEDLEIVLTEIEGGFLMSAVLAAAPRDKREAFFSLLMNANVMGQGTKGGVLALDEKDDVVLSQMVAGHVGQREFQEAIEDFISAVDQWKAATLAAAS